MNEMRRSTKKRKYDEVDIFINHHTSKKLTTQTLKQNIASVKITELPSYWNSPEARLLFCPSTTGCVSSDILKNISLLLSVTYNDASLLKLLDGCGDLFELSHHQRQTLRHYCLYLS